MPELHFTVRWPDGTAQSYYSPSTTVREHLSADTSYALEDFLTRTRAAMQHASDRVLARYGYRCSSAMDTLARIEAAAGKFAAQHGVQVHVVDFDY